MRKVSHHNNKIYDGWGHQIVPVSCQAFELIPSWEPTAAPRCEALPPAGAPRAVPGRAPVTPGWWGEARAGRALGSSLPAQRAPPGEAGGLWGRPQQGRAGRDPPGPDTHRVLPSPAGPSPGGGHGLPGPGLPAGCPARPCPALPGPALPCRGGSAPGRSPPASPCPARGLQGRCSQAGSLLSPAAPWAISPPPQPRCPRGAPAVAAGPGRGQRRARLAAGGHGLHRARGQRPAPPAPTPRRTQPIIFIYTVMKVLL